MSEAKAKLKSGGKRFSKFSIVGLSNAAIDIGVLNLFLWLEPTREVYQLVLYNSVALVLANLNSYLWNTLWTFRHQAQHDAKQVSLFTAQGLLNIALGSAILWLAAHGLRGYTELSPWLSGNLAKAISIVSVSIVSFLFLRFFVFRPKEGRTRP